MKRKSGIDPKVELLRALRARAGERFTLDQVVHLHGIKNASTVRRWLKVMLSVGLVERHTDQGRYFYGVKVESHALWPPTPERLAELGVPPPCKVCGGKAEWEEVVEGCFEPHCLVAGDCSHDGRKPVVGKREI